MSADEPVLVDARGHRCPTPTLRLRRAAERTPPGRRLLLLADDPLARIDVPHFAAGAGLTLLSVEAEGALLRFLLVRRTETAAPVEPGGPDG